MEPIAGEYTHVVVNKLQVTKDAVLMINRVAAILGQWVTDEAPEAGSLDASVYTRIALSVVGNVTQRRLAALVNPFHRDSPMVEQAINAVTEHIMSHYPEGIDEPSENDAVMAAVKLPPGGFDA